MAVDICSLHVVWLVCDTANNKYTLKSSQVILHAVVKCWKFHVYYHNITISPFQHHERDNTVGDFVIESQDSDSMTQEPQGILGSGKEPLYLTLHGAQY